MWSRIHLIPLLQAEEDRDQVRRYWADKEREKVLLGTDLKVYNSDRYVEQFLVLLLRRKPFWWLEERLGILFTVRGPGLLNCIADWVFGNIDSCGLRMLRYLGKSRNRIVC